MVACKQDTSGYQKQSKQTAVFMTVSHLPKLVKERAELSFQVCILCHSVTDHVRLEEEQNDGGETPKTNHSPVHLSQ